MSADEFWRDDPQLFVSYRTSFINKKKRELEETDYKCWLQGLYIHDGNSKISSHLRQFISNTISSMFKGKKDNSKIENYPGKPYTELEKDKRKQDKETMRTNKYKEYENSLVYYGTLKQQYIERIKNKAKKGE
jgi:hypothetical protein